MMCSYSEAATHCGSLCAIRRCSCWELREYSTDATKVTIIIAIAMVTISIDYLNLLLQK